MFSFHKPKVYRSSTGCCICRAKSSSSRFTDSKKYEDDFMDCFQLHERRSGEICNACVLLVKRWKKLPPGSERNWRHVVDARAGPGTKSLTKFKSKNKKKLKQKGDTSQKLEKLIKKKHIYLKNDRSAREQSPGSLSDDATGDDFITDLSTLSRAQSLAPSPTPSEEIVTTTKHRSKAHSPHRREKAAKRRSALSPTISSFLDMTFWKREKVCCGTIFKGPYGEVIVDPRFLKPCHGCKPKQRAEVQSVAGKEPGSSGAPECSKNTGGPNKLTKSYSDSSSDSGYDESSNQGPEAVRSRRTASREDAGVPSNPLAEFAIHAASRCQQNVASSAN
ncbi:SIN3-HDAC complex-associated factor [Schistocerca serialis cubense]|uniref:SIN3-HDAC complex-associated factor n=1 Tax=Schistocerca serialis cubense TaxID=2023355 RepID=UPI00214E879A|nr:SIN3-HDAC complex-associated factor [Schistocerca serialis cubense]XP_049962380.1 SIN3-HDAC complex-associated factor [Schistocerca serialis cubense]